MSFEMDLAKRLEACQNQFAPLTATNQNQNLDAVRSRSRHLHPIQFRPERDFSLELANHPSNQNHHSFNQYQANNPTARRMRELAMYNYIATSTHFFSEEPEKRERQSRLLKHYIELYAHNPNTYPVDPQNEIHCVIHQAGQAVLRAERENQRKEEQNRQNSTAKGTDPSDAMLANVAFLKKK